MGNPRHKIKVGKIYLVTTHSYPHYVEYQHILKAICTNYYDCTFNVLATQGTSVEVDKNFSLLTNSYSIKECVEVAKTDLPLYISWPQTSSKFAEVLHD